MTLAVLCHVKAGGTSISIRQHINQDRRPSLLQKVAMRCCAFYGSCVVLRIKCPTPATQNVLSMGWFKKSVLRLEVGDDESDCHSLEISGFIKATCYSYSTCITLLVENFDEAMAVDSASAIEFLVRINKDASDSNLFNIIVECTEPSNACTILNKFRNLSACYIIVKEKQRNVHDAVNSYPYNARDEKRIREFEEALYGFNRYVCRCHSHAH